MPTFAKNIQNRKAAFIGCFSVLKGVTILWSFQHIGHSTEIYQKHQGPLLTAGLDVY
jgi:hypothetical protein